MKTISLVTTSRGRLHHIKQTLPLMMALGADEVIVVDYGCPDGTGDWVRDNCPDAKVVHVSDDLDFCPARARNFGARQAGSDWLLFIDADIEAEPRWMRWLQQHLEPGGFYRAAPVGRRRDIETYGTFICMRSDFEAVGGYDEVFRGWGGEDGDLYHRLQARGLVNRNYPNSFVSAIAHGDEERAGWPGFANKAQRIVVTACYTSAKLQAAKLLVKSGNLPIEMRQRLMDHTVAKLQPWFAGGAKEPLEIRYVLGSSRLAAPSPYAVGMKLAFIIDVGTLAASQIDLEDIHQYRLAEDRIPLPNPVY